MPLSEDHLKSIRRQHPAAKLWDGMRHGRRNRPDGVPIEPVQAHDLVHGKGQVKPLLAGHQQAWQDLESRIGRS